ncbi:MULTISPECIES: Asp-tRNA(Asn)/Glu-tRNA(Gln) amidotransferase subunit GatC [unclassified Legionella]|uniref:Asp-tRNA(Asn)/Glu-tRNA(Gln) amidotransferase subunit GatC n=1 Tax=unclassified Legionella TaxID=2622702 RepID=UPI001056B505|nr:MULTISPECIES: Asp-tRNA(Asn)/Glu-tRNA(Gln) amidotransferase subunit GatC [unclassified Legionella]MDI9819289.1 Asp-tRNA(Asn)/Glu-tRNA(Gln) amidotransferase subunit GatC [Legionella sp. PL877]
MTTITESDLQTLEQLAALATEPEHNIQLAEEITAIMNFVEQLREVNTTDIAPLFHPLDLHQRLRVDEVNEQDCRAQLAEIAPLFENDLYLVPEVIDSGQ